MRKSITLFHALSGSVLHTKNGTPCSSFRSLSPQLSDRTHAIEENLMKKREIMLSRALLPKEVGVMDELKTELI